MKAIVLCHGHFGDVFTQAIVDRVPAGIHVIRSRHPVEAATQPPNVLAVLSGSPANQASQSVRVRMGGGSAKGPFEVKLGELEAFFEKLLGGTSP